MTLWDDQVAALIGKNESAFGCPLPLITAVYGPAAFDALDSLKADGRVREVLIGDGRSYWKLTHKEGA